MKKVYISLAVCFATAFADDGLEGLKKALEEATEIATVSKMNVDYVPSVVNVLRGEKLKALGVTNVSEALALLPGVQIYQNQLGDNITVVRGFRNPNAYLSDKIKVMLDGAAVNTQSYGSAGFIMDLPIALVERIEILRGPGSTMYGSGAFYGAVNIITKTANKSCDNEIFVGGGSWYYKKIGSTVNYSKEGLIYSADGYYQGNQRKITVDKSYTDAGGSFPRSFETSEGFDDYSVGFNLKSENLSWNTRFKKSKQGNYYGIEERLEPRDDTGHSNAFFNTELAYKIPTANGDFSVKGGVSDYSYKMEGITRDAGYLPGVLTGFSYNFDYELRAIETTAYVDLLHRLKNIGSHKISYGGGFSRSFLRDNYYSSNIENYAFSSMLPIIVATQPAMKFPQNNELFKNGTKRDIASLYFEDLYPLSDNADLVFGARIDDYSDLDTQFSYRLGAAFRWLDDSLITKFIYSTGHRAPTFAEKYAREHIGFRAGDDFLKPESIKSFEVGAVYKPNDTHSISLNGYYSELDNVVDIEEDSGTVIGHTNYPKRISKGIEAEYSYKPSNTHELHLNYTLNKTTYLNVDNMTLQDMPDVSPRMYKGWYIYRPSNDLTFGLRYFIFSKTVQNSAFSNKDTMIGGNDLLNAAVTYKLFKDAEMSININNLQNKEQKMPSYYYRNEPNRNGGMIRDGRNFIAELRYKF